MKKELLPLESLCPLPLKCPDSSWSVWTLFYLLHSVFWIALHFQTHFIINFPSFLNLSLVVLRLLFCLDCLTVLFMWINLLFSVSSGCFLVLYVKFPKCEWNKLQGICWEWVRLVVLVMSQAWERRRNDKTTRQHQRLAEWMHHSENHSESIPHLQKC